MNFGDREIGINDAYASWKLARPFQISFSHTCKKRIRFLFEPVGRLDGAGSLPAQRYRDVEIKGQVGLKPVLYPVLELQ